MASKTHIRRVKAARRALKKRMELQGLDYNSHADHMKLLSDLHARIVARKPARSTGDA